MFGQGTGISLAMAVEFVQGTVELVFEHGFVADQLDQVSIVRDGKDHFLARPAQRFVAQGCIKIMIFAAAAGYQHTFQLNCPPVNPCAYSVLPGGMDR